MLKQLISRTLVGTLIVAALGLPTLAAPSTAPSAGTKPGTVSVKGYRTKKGKWVKPHTRRRGTHRNHKGMAKASPSPAAIK